jgi:hypothetical protein
VVFNISLYNTFMLSSIKKRFIHASPSAKAIIVLLFFVILALIIPIEKTGLNVVGVLSAAAIFYSILLGFYISAAMTNLSRLKTLVATETGALIAFYYLTKLSLPEKLDEVTEKIDTYLIKRFDYEVDTYTEPTTKEFFAIFDVLKDAEGKSAGESAAMTYLGEGMYYVPQARRELTIVGDRVVDSASWIVLNILSLVIIISLFLTRDGTIASSLIAALLSATAVLALFILDDVDSNRFGEDQFAINTYQDVFAAIGKTHYYSKHYLAAGRFTPTVKEYRTGTSNQVVTVNKNN